MHQKFINLELKRFILAFVITRWKHRKKFSINGEPDKAKKKKSSILHFMPLLTRSIRMRLNFKFKVQVIL